MKVDGSLNSLLQGVSQQPPRDRLPGQATLQENMLSDPIAGLTRRPATDLVGSLGISTDVRGWHNFQTNDGQKFIAFFHDSAVDVFDLNAVQKTVTYGAGSQAYITLAGDLRSATLDNDDTYTVNTSFKPAMAAATASYYNTSHCGIIQVLGGQYARNFAITLDGVTVAKYLTVRGDSAGHAPFVQTTHIAEVLEWLLLNVWVDAASDPATFPNPATYYNAFESTGAMSAAATWSVTRFEDAILVVNLAGTPFTLGANDDAGNKNMKAMTDQVPGTEDLPRIAPHLYIARVAEKTDPEEDLWFKFIVDGQEANLVPSDTYFGKPGYWQETVKPGVPTTLDASTMPHVLTYNSTAGTFEFRQEAWKDRAVGTLVSNPDPSFMGLPVKDITSFQGRLVLIAGSSVITSRTNRNTDFWIGSAAEQVATDPIDVKSKVEASSLNAAVQFNKDLVVFSNKGQFIMQGGSKLSPESAALVLTSSFEAELTAKPVSAGRNVFFATAYGNYTNMREFYAAGSTNINDSRPITQHVQKYLQGGVTRLATSSNYNVLLVNTDQSAKEQYVYQYIWSDTQKVQSAWHKWILSHDIVYTFFDKELVYYVQKIGNEYFLSRMSLDVQDSTGVGYHAYLDHRFDVFGCYSTFQLPYDYLATDDLVIVQGTNCPNPGMTVPITSIVYDGGLAAYVVTLKYNMLGGDIICGTRWTWKYMPTMPIVKDRTGTAIATGKLRLRSFLITLSKTGGLKGQATSKYGNGEVVEYNARVVGDINNVVGVQPIADDTFTMPFRHDARLAELLLYGDTHLPASLLDIEWQGQYLKRGKRIASGNGG